MLTFAIDLFQDINVLGVSSEIDEVVEMGGESFFVADDGASGSELWKTDGTSGGTMLVKDVLPGPDTSEPSNLTVVGDTLFFTALDEEGETDLWQSDGTEAGTVQVFDADASGVYYLSDLTASGDKLFFTAYEMATGYELWVSDGTAGGTELVLDINSDQLVIDRPQDLTDVNGTLFFTSYESGYDNRELWKSNGTAAGTVMVADLGIDPGDDGILGTPDDDEDFSSNPTYLTNLDGVLYFAAEDFLDGVELYKSDGTEAGTVRVADLNTGGSSYPEELTPFGGQLFFSASADGTNRHLFKSNGTTIELVADTTDGTGSSAPVSLEVVGNELFFAASGVAPATTVSATSPTMTATNSRLFSSGYAGIVAERTSPSGGLLAGFRDGLPSSVTFNSTTLGSDADPPGFTDVNDRIGAEGIGLESIQAGDFYVEDIDLGNPGDLVDDFWEWTISDAAGLTNISFAGFASGNEFDSPDEGLLFELFLNGSNTSTATTTVAGDALDNWFAGRDAANISLANAGGPTITTATVRVSIGNPTYPNPPSGGNEAFLINATLTADLSSETTAIESVGRELHKTDGTTEGTVLVKDIVTNGSSNPFQLKEVGGKLFFAADDVFGDGLELWVSDGTESGTMQLVDSLPGNGAYGDPLDGAPRLLGEVGGDLLFTTTNTARDRELWLSNGTTAGTQEIVNINPSTDDANVSDLIAFGPTLYFVANNGLDGEAIYKADTTTGDVTLHADLSESSTDKISRLTILSPVNEQIVFYNSTLGTAGGVYVVNAAGERVQVSDLRPVELDDEGTLFVVANNTIFFVADDGTSGNELWRVTGLGQATLVSDLIPGTSSSNPSSLTEFEGSLYFTANTNSESPTGDVGREMFMTDGFNVTVSDTIRPGNSDSDPQELTVAGDDLFFTANDGSTGRELWRRQSNGSVSPVADIRSGGNSSSPIELTDVDGTLYFSANNGSTGYEPYRVNDTATGVIALGNLNPGGASSEPQDFFAALGDVYFSASDGTTGSELYKTDGTANSATLVSDINSSGDSDPVPLIDTGKRLIFSAAGTLNEDRELWSTDGVTNTLLVEDLYPPEFFGSNPEELVEIDGKYYFAAENGPFGRELFVMEEVAPTVMEVMVGGDAGSPVAEVQRSSVGLVTLVFDGNVDVPDSAIQVINRDTDTALTTVVVNTRFEDGKTYVEVTFNPGQFVVERDELGTTGQLNSLADGNYQLNVLSAQVTSPVSGADMEADYQFGEVEADRFFRHFGDTDGDRDVDGQDYGRFGLTFLKTTASPDYDENLDVDGDGDVDGQDYGAFGQRFLKTLDFA